MSKTGPSFSSCEICLHPFNTKANLPKLLPCCGKTFCLRCLNDMQEGDLTCFWCHKAHEIPFGSLPTNEKLLEITKEASQWEICPLHLEPIKLYCFEDKCKICAYCGYSTACKDHRLVPLRDLNSEVEKSKKECEGNMGEINARYNTACDYLQKTRLVVEELMNEFFKKEEIELKERKAQIMGEFSLSFDGENKILERDYEVNSLGKSLKKIKFAYESFFKVADPGQILKDYSALTVRTKALIQKEGEKDEFEKELSELIPKIQEILAYEALERQAKWEELHEKLTNLRRKAQALDVSIEIIDEKADNISDGTTEILDDKAQALDEATSLKSEKEEVSDIEEEEESHNKKNLCFDFSNNKSVTVISAYECYRYHARHPFLQENLLKKLTEVELDFTGAGFNEASSEELESILGKIKRFSALKIGSKGEIEEISEKASSKIFEMLGNNPQVITRLTSSFPFQNESLTFLNSVLSKLSTLKTLNIQFWPCNIHNVSAKNLGEFSKNFASLAPGLVNLDLNFSGLDISDSFIKSLYQPMPLLESFSLNVRAIKDLKVKALKSLVENIEELMPNLKDLMVDVSKTKIRSSDLEIINFEGKTSHIEKVKVARDDLGFLAVMCIFLVFVVLPWLIYGPDFWHYIYNGNRYYY